jgi:hypothetical protein
MRIEEYCKDINKWPDSWKGFQKDVKCGNKILREVFIPFLEYLIENGLSKRTIKRHIDNTWLLGGEIIRSININENLRELESQSLVKEFVYEEGRPYCRHIDTEEEQKSFDSTCKKSNKFLNLK